MIRRPAPVLVVGAVVGWLVWSMHRPGRLGLDAASFARFHVVGLEVGVCLLGLVVVSIVQHRSPRGAAWLALAIALHAVGVARVPGLARPAVVAITAAWLGGGPAVLLVALARTHERFARLDRRVIVTSAAALVVTAAVAAGLDRGRGLDATLGPLPAGAVPHGVRLWVALNGVAVIVVSVMVATRMRRARRPATRPRRGDPVVPAALGAAAVLTAERIVHLLPRSAFRDDYRGVYRLWSANVALTGPIVAMAAVLLAIGWNELVRPRPVPTDADRLILEDREPLRLLRDDLAGWLGDPSLELAYADGTGRWATADGLLDREEIAYPRAATTVSRAGRPIGLIVHDVALGRAPAALRAAAALAGMAFDANRSVAVSEANLLEARRLGQRLLLADLTMRDDLRRELAEPLGRLRACAATLGTDEPLERSVTELRQVTAEVRRISHGLYPPELVEGGLAAVLDRAVGPPERRLPAAVEITAYLLSVDDPSTAFEDLGDELVVRRSRPLTDRAALDRVDVLGGMADTTRISLPIEGL